MKGMITDIQKFSLHDGPGIRTTIFFKGCGLRCAWCHNPEAIGFARFLRFEPEHCVGCGACYRACKTGALTMERRVRAYDEAKCVHCFACADACTAGALTVTGYEIEAEEVARIALEDMPYYEASGGGVTLSGGEPTAQGAFAAELLARLKDAGADTAVETSLCMGYDALAPLLPLLSRVYCDIKLLDDAAHRRYTGAPNAGILAGVARLAERNIPLTVRTPLIPGITDGEENIGGIAAWLAEHAPNATYELLNYNPLAASKWADLGHEYLPGEQKPLDPDRFEALQALARARGVQIVRGQE